MERVGLQVEHVGEGAVRVDLVVLEGVEVEAGAPIGHRLVAPVGVLRNINAEKQKKRRTTKIS